MLNGEIKFDKNEKIRGLKISYPFALEWNEIPDFLVLAGKNGSGKSSLFELINRKFCEKQEKNPQNDLNVIFRSTRLNQQNNYLEDGQHELENGTNLDWISSASKVIDEFSEELTSKTSFTSTSTISLLTNKPMGYLVELVDDYNQFVFELFSKTDSLEEIESHIQNRKEKLLSLFGSINSKLLKYKLGYRISWKQFVNENKTRKQDNFQTMITLISTENSSVHLFYGDFTPGHKALFDVLVWTSIIEQDMLNVGLIILDQPDAHLDGFGLEILVRIINSFILNCAVGNKSIQIMLSTNRVDFLRLVKQYFPHDFLNIGFLLKACDSKPGSHVMNEKLIQPIPNSMV